MAIERFIESNGCNGWVGRGPGQVEQFVDLYNYIVYVYRPYYREGKRMANERFIESNGYNGWLARRPRPMEQW